MKYKFFPLLLLLVFLSGCLNLGEEKPFTEEKSKEVAREFVENSPTYKFDGFDLEYKKTLYIEMKDCPYCWGFIFEFKSRHAGYGDRGGKMLAQVITPHKAMIIVQKNKVTRAMLDEKWDMLNQKFFEATTLEESFCGSSTYGSCSSDDDCIPGGCSGQVCQSKNEESIITTCEWRDCYDNEKYGLECKCLENKCQWAKKKAQPI